MKQQNNKRDCKIVRDLLPNYIEKLTDEVTNEFIEEHIASCEECRRALHNMNGEVEIEEFDQDEEINYLKKINTKVKMTIAVVSLIVIIIASCVSLYIYNKNKIQVNNYTFLKAECIKENENGTKDGNLYSNLIAVIDEKGICKSVRVVEEGYTEDYIIENMKNIRENSDAKGYMNVRIEKEKIHYNLNIWNGYTKQQIKEKWEEIYIKIQIEEI